MERSDGTEILRDAFRDLRQFNVDGRAARRFKLPREARELLFNADFFNVFNAATFSLFPGRPARSLHPMFAGREVSCATGAVFPANSAFQLVKDASFCTKNPRYFNTNTSSDLPLTIQLGVWFQF
jgi:hypothetical protein